MNAQSESEEEMVGWFSTYGLITAQRILERYQIRLHQDDLVHTFKTPGTFYYQLLRLPLRNVFNGIILQQVQDYQVYAQKLIIDYLLSGQENQTEDAPGSGAREDLERERKNLVNLNKDFRDLELAHEKLIAKSQLILIGKAKEWQLALNKIVKNLKEPLKDVGVMDSAVIIWALKTLLCGFSLKEDITNKKEIWDRVEKRLGVTLNSDLRNIFINQVHALTDITLESDPNYANFQDQILLMSRRVREFRTEFYQLILRSKEIINFLPDYRKDIAKEEKNRSSLLFNSNLGDDLK